MTGDADIAQVAALVADPSRARILSALTDLRALPASVLAAEAGVTAATASGHLAQLTEAGLLGVERSGRYRYYRLAGPEVAEALEALGRLAPATPVRSLREGTRANALRRSRSCYDHLAGQLGTALMAALLDRGVLEGDGDYRLTPAGRDELAAFGIDATGLPGRRPLIRYCVDWTEQRHHLSGKLGAALASRMFELDWIRRAPTHRAVDVTAAGSEGLRRVFGVAADATVSGSASGSAAARGRARTG